MSVAIDFGTSNTVVARINPQTQQPETIALPGLSRQIGDNPPLIPSLLYVQQAAENKVVAGQTVCDRGLDVAQDQRFFRNFKRGIGTDVQGFLPTLDGQPMGFEQVGQWFLGQIIQQLQLSDPDLNTLIFTVPVDSFETYRHWLGDACADLAIDQVRLLDEPTAAALGYGIPGDTTLLVIDFGGGTLDFSLVQLAPEAQAKPLGFILKWGKKSMAKQSAQRVQTARVLAKAGESLGGADIDQWILQHFQQTQGLEPSPLTQRLAERLKIHLSTASTAQEAYFNDETFDTYDLRLRRDQFDQLLADNSFFERLDQRLTQVLQQGRRQGVEVADIDAVLLVGGTAQIPAVKRWVQGYFDPDKIKGERPFEAIAQGALQIQSGLQLQDFLYHGYGIRYWDRRKNCHSWHQIIPQGQSYPMSEPVELVLGASSENQPSLELILGEMAEESSRTEVYFEGDQLITRQVGGAEAAVQPLNDRDGARTIARLDPPGFPGQDRLRLRFRVDRERFLRLTVDDLLTLNTLMSDQPVVQLS